VGRFMSATLSANTCPENAPREGLGVPPGMDSRSTPGAIPSRFSSATLARTVASSDASHSTPASKRHDRLIDAGIAVAAFAASLPLLVVGDTRLSGHGGGLIALAILLTALTSLPLIARRRAPLLVFVLTALASIALRAIAEPSGPPIGPTVALYTLAAAGEGSRAGTRRTLALVVTFLLAHVAAGGLSNADVGLLFGVLLWGGTWLAGDRARLRAERMAELEDRALRAEREAERERLLAVAEERMRIARDLHDSAGHAINVILVHAGLGRLRTERDPAGARDAFETIEEVARETVGEIDQLVGVLREDAPASENGGEVEPPPGVAALDGLVARHRAAGLDVTATVRGDRRALSPSVDRGAYRIVQEGLTNAARHGDGSAQVEVAFGDSALEVTVANPLRPGGQARADGGGHGVIGMRERAALLGGSLEAGARDGHFRVRACLPFAERVA
jgi:signal transduction histidine kinase